MQLKNKILKQYLNVVILILLAIETNCWAKQIKVESVSLNKYYYVPAQGPEKGGTVLYISGVNLPTQNKELSAFIGPYPCIIMSQQSTKEILACKTSPMRSSKHQKQLRVTLRVEGQLPILCLDSMCRFSYVKNTLLTREYDQQEEEQQIPRKNLAELQERRAYLLERILVQILVQCAPNQFWVESTKTCFNCSNRPNSTGIGNKHYRICNCINGFIWNAQKNLCEACSQNSIAINHYIPYCSACSNYAYTTGLRNKNDNYACICRESFYWFSYGIGLGGYCECPSNSLLINQKCLLKLSCSSNQFLLLSNNTCLSCLGRPNSTGLGSHRLHICLCYSGFIWNANKGLCQACGLNSISINNRYSCQPCSYFGFSTGLLNPSSNNSCSCINNLKWYSFGVGLGGFCGCPSNTILVQRTCQAIKTCSENQFLLSDNTCYTCKNRPDSIGLGSSDLQICFCNIGFFWNKKLDTCEACPQNSISVYHGYYCQPCSGLNMGPRNTNNTCSCLNSFQWYSNGLWGGYCACPSNRLMINGTCVEKLLCPSNSFLVELSNTCYSCNNRSNSTGFANHDHQSCQCYRGFYWNYDKQSCEICPQNSKSKYRGARCQSCLKDKYSLGVKNKANQADNNTCICLKTFDWIQVQEQQSGYCGCAENMVQIHGYCTAKAKCLPTQFWRYDNTCFSCSNRPNSTGMAYSNNQTHVCLCFKRFFWKMQTESCQICPQNSISLDATTTRSQNCRPCSDYLHSTGFLNKTNPQDNNTCSCKYGFVWSSVTSNCVCSMANAVVLGGECFVCSDIVSYSNGTAADSYSCHCNETFIFNQESKQCICPLNFILIQDQCFNCGSIASFSNGAALNSEACSCSPPLVFSTISKSCTCSQSNSIIDQKGSCFQCDSLKGRNSSGYVNKSSQIAACQCNQTFIFNQTTKICQCPDQNQYILQTGICISCSSIVDSVAVNGTCVCRETYVYSRRLNKCICALRSIILQDGSCFACETLLNRNSNGLANQTTGNTCQCLRTFVFNAVNRSCDCPVDSFVSKSEECVSCKDAGGNLQFNRTTQECVCNSTFVYNAASNKCECPPYSIILDGSCFSCSNLRNRNGTGRVDEATGNTCKCLSSYVFNASTKSCECPDPNSYVSEQCVSCSNVGNGTGKALPNAKACKCIDPTFVYNEELSQCLCPQSTFFNLGSCIPKDNCSKPNMVKIGEQCFNCSSITQYSNGTASNNSTCYCNPTFVFDSQTKSCVCPLRNSIVDISGACFSCQALNYQNSNGLINISQPNSCQCYQTFFFNKTSNICECQDNNSYISIVGICISCSSIVDSVAVNGTCVCRETYVYSRRLNKCICALRSIILQDGSCFACETLLNRNSNGLANQTTGNTCQCLRTFVFNAANRSCDCPVDSFVSKSEECVSCKDAGGNLQFNRTTQECVCNSTFVYNAASNKCECPPYSIILDGSCFSCSNLRNRNGTGRVDEATGNTCKCLSSYVFNASTKSCECPDPNSYVSEQCVSCSNVGNGTGKALPNAKACKFIDPTFVYNEELNRCLCRSGYIFNGKSCSFL